MMGYNKYATLVVIYIYIYYRKEPDFSKGVFKNMLLKDVKLFEKKLSSGGLTQNALLLLTNFVTLLPSIFAYINNSVLLGTYTKVYTVFYLGNPVVIS